MKDEKITVVILPGLNGTDGLIRNFVEKTPKGFETIVIPYPTHEKYTYQQLASYVKLKVSSIKGDYIVVGESFSGPIAVLISSENRKGHIGTILVATFITAPTFKIFRYMPWSIFFGFQKKINPIAKKLIKNNIYTQIGVELQKISTAVLCDRIKSIFKLNVKNELKLSRCPFMYLRGNKDFIVPAKNVLKILSIKPSVTVVKFDTQHFILQLMPDEAWSEIKKFVVRIKNQK